MCLLKQVCLLISFAVYVLLRQKICANLLSGPYPYVRSFVLLSLTREGGFWLTQIANSDIPLLWALS